MYGPASGGGGGGGGGGPKERTFTPKGQMSGGANQRPPLLDLPPHLRVMFDPNPPLQYKPPMTKPESKPYDGIASLCQHFEKTPPPPRDYFESPQERKQRIKDQLVKLNNEKVELMLSDWKPTNNPKATEKPYNTLFVGRMSYDTNDKKLKREFEQYGPIRSVKVVTDVEGKPRGYAFIEFEREDDVAVAYKRADGKKIDGRRIVVDVERGRTVRNWKPRRFGGGLGGRKVVPSKKKLEEDSKKLASGGGGFSGGAGGGGGYSSPRAQPSAGGGDTARIYGPAAGGGAAPASGGGSDRDRGGSRDRSRTDRSDRDGGGGSSRYGPASGTGLGYSGGNGSSSSSGNRRSRSRDRGSGGGGSDRRRPRSPDQSSYEPSRDSKRYR